MKYLNTLIFSLALSTKAFACDTITDDNWQSMVATGNITVATGYVNYGSFGGSGGSVATSDSLSDPSLRRFQHVFLAGEETEDPEAILQEFERRYNLYLRSQAIASVAKSVWDATAESLCVGVLTTQALKVLGHADASGVGGVLGTGFSLAAKVFMGKSFNLLSNEVEIHHETIQRLYGKMVHEDSWVRMLYEPTRPFIRDLMKTYVKNKRNLPKKLQKDIESSLYKLASGNNKSLAAGEMPSWEENIEYVVNFPTKSRPVSFVEERFERLFANYSADIKDAFRQIARRHVFSCKDTAGTNGTYKTTLIVWGPPGVGKTHAAETLAESIGSTFSEIPFSQIQDMSKFWGHYSWPIKEKGLLSEAFSNPTVSDVSKKASLGVPCRNPFILLDEFDKPPISDPALLALFDPDKKTIKAGIWDNLDISHATFILNLNQDPRALVEMYRTLNPSLSSFWEALIDRSTVVHIPGIPDDEKRTLLWTKFIPSYLRSQSSDIKLEMSDIERHADEISALISVKDRRTGEINPGMRTLVIDLNRTLDRLLQEKITEMSRAVLSGAAPSIAFAASSAREMSSPRRTDFRLTDQLLKNIYTIHVLRLHQQGRGASLALPHAAGSVGLLQTASGFLAEAVMANPLTAAGIMTAAIIHNMRK